MFSPTRWRRRGKRAGHAFSIAIRQFTQDIGISSAVPTPSRPVDRPTPHSGRRRKLAVALCLLVLIAGGLYVGPRLAGPDPVPSELVGNWATTSPGYEGRNLVLTRDSLFLRSSAREGTGYTVQRVNRKQMAQGSAYVVTSSSEPAGEYTVTLQYNDENQTLAMGNPSHILWHRVH